MNKPEDFGSIDEALKQLPPEMRSRIEPVVRTGQPAAFLAVLRTLHGQIGDFINRVEKRGDTSPDPGTRGVEGDPGEKPAPAVRPTARCPYCGRCLGEQI